MTPSTGEHLTGYARDYTQNLLYAKHAFCHGAMGAPCTVPHHRLVSQHASQRKGLCGLSFEWCGCSIFSTILVCSSIWVLIEGSRFNLKHLPLTDPQVENAGKELGLRPWIAISSQSRQYWPKRINGMVWYVCLFFVIHTKKSPWGKTNQDHRYD